MIKGDNTGGSVVDWLKPDRRGNIARNITHDG